MTWNDYRSSPPVGTVLGHRGDLAEGTTLSLSKDTGSGAFPILLVASGGTIRAFVNLCPHQDLPLDAQSREIISADGTTLLCSNHQAGFRIEDGVGVKDLGIDCALDLIPIAVDDDGSIHIV